MNSDVSQIKYKGVVAFDLDGTLIRGIRHSWSLLWNAVGYSRQAVTKNKKNFIEGNLDYKQWVEIDCCMLKKYEVTLAKVRKAISDSSCSLVKNFLVAINKLKANGYFTAIISGGVDVVLNYFVPDADSLLDAIYINRMIWAENGELENIIPTEYDWDTSKRGVLGKSAGLKHICDKCGVDLANSIFVGNDENDLAAMKIAGKKILFSSQTLGIDEMVEGIHIEQRNDLMVVVDYILSEYY